MTEAELVHMEVRARGHRPTLVGEARGSHDDVPALVAEVRRLRGLVQAAEWGHGWQQAMCPWCGAERPCAHEPDCPAFPAEPR